MLKRLLAASLAIALGGFVAWNVGAMGDRASAGATPVEYDVHEEMTLSVEDGPGGGGGGGGASSSALSDIAGEAGLSGAGTYY